MMKFSINNFPLLNDYKELKNKEYKDLRREN